MENLIISSAGFFLYDEKTEKWSVLGITNDLNKDEVRLPTVESRKSEDAAYQLVVDLFYKLGLHQEEPFVEVYRVRDQESNAIILNYLINNPVIGFPQPLSKLNVVQVIEVEHQLGNKDCFYLEMWEINAFEEHLHPKDRDPFTALVMNMESNPKFKKDNQLLIHKIESSINIS